MRSIHTRNATLKLFLFNFALDLSVETVAGTANTKSLVTEHSFQQQSQLYTIITLFACILATKTGQSESGVWQRIVVGKLVA